MKKCIAFLLAAALFIGTVFGYNLFLDHELCRRTNNLRYTNDTVKLQCVDSIVQSLDAHSMLVLGSSELNDTKEASYPGNLYKRGDSDFNMSFVGYGNYTSLIHTIYIGALEKNVPNKKVVFIISPQWFAKNYLKSDTFSSIFTQRAFDRFIKNNDISKNIKQKVIDRCIPLLEKDKSEQSVIKRYDSVYLKGSPNFINRLYLTLDNLFQVVKTKRDAVRNIHKDAKFTKTEVKADSIDFNTLMASEETEGKQNSTNNPFYISDSYYNKNVVPHLDSMKNNSVNCSFLDSTEYDDLRLFLDVCKETGIKPLLVSVPVNGYWYDYMGFSKSDRQQYYQNIRDIASQYNVELADFSSDEYTKYFFKDIWHIGWKGWAALDKQIYAFYKNSDSENTQ